MPQKTMEGTYRGQSFPSQSRENIMKNIIQSIKDYGEIQSERSKIMSEILTNQIKAKQNWFFKMQEMNYQTDYQKQLMQKLQQPQGEGMGAGMGGNGQINPFAEQVQPQVRYGEKAPEVYYPKQKEYIYQRIQEKKRRKMPLTAKEQEFEDKYLGINKDLTTSQRIDKANAIKVLEDGGIAGESFKNREEAEAYILDTFKVNLDDPDIQNVLNKYKSTGEKVTKRFWQKYPRKNKFGYTYEKREDGNWHLVEE